MLEEHGKVLEETLFCLSGKAKISGVRLNPHRFRHTFATQYLVAGGDIFSLQKILGHSSLEVVRMDVNLMSSDIIEQHRKFSPVDNAILPGKTNRT